VEHACEHKNFSTARVDKGLFDTLDEVHDQATRWMWNCNHVRPNVALGCLTPQSAAGHGRFTLL